MPEVAVAPLTSWANFYVIVGSAAAALTGLMFVVITLIAGVQTRTTTSTLAAFGTPTVVHFCSALLLAAILSAPWQALWHVAVLLGLCGLGGVTYVIVVLLRARHQDGYEPVAEDWLWHTILPGISYIVLVIAAISLPTNAVPSLFGVGAMMVLLLFIGIHNSWDTVTYVLISRYQVKNKDQDQQTPEHVG